MGSRGSKAESQKGKADQGKGSRIRQNGSKNSKIWRPWRWSNLPRNCYAPLIVVLVETHVASSCIDKLVARTELDVLFALRL